MADDRGQRSEVRGRKGKVQKSEVGGRMSEGQGRRSEDRWMMDDRSAGKMEDVGHKAEIEKD